MKKLFSIISIVCLFAFVNTANAQRFGTGKNNDKTGRVMTYDYSAVSYAAVLHHKPNASETFYKIGKLTGALTDSISIKNAKVCDKVVLMFECDTLTAGRVVTFGTNYVSAGTLTVDKNQKATISFVFDGVAFIETSRAKQ